MRKCSATIKYWNCSPYWKYSELFCRIFDSNDKALAMALGNTITSLASKLYLFIGGSFRITSVGVSAFVPNFWAGGWDVWKLFAIIWMYMGGSSTLRWWAHLTPTCCNWTCLSFCTQNWQGPTNLVLHPLHLLTFLPVPCIPHTPNNSLHPSHSCNCSHPLYLSYPHTWHDTDTSNIHAVIELSTTCKRCKGYERCKGCYGYKWLCK